MPTQDQNSSNEAFIKSPSFTGNIGDELKSPRQLTFGEKAVGLTFNPGGHEQVNKIKTLAAALIDEIADQRAGNPNSERHPEKWDQYTEAIRRIQEGQMWAVKSATWQY